MRALILLLSLLLSACGGGDPEPERSIGPPDCRTLDERREYLDVVERRRGKAAADQLRATIRKLWEARKA